MGGLLIDHLMCLVLLEVVMRSSTVVELIVMLFYLFFFQKVKKKISTLLVGDAFSNIDEQCIVIYLKIEREKAKNEIGLGIQHDINFDLPKINIISTTQEFQNKTLKKPTHQ